jgi:hypothetical protein
MGYTDSAPMAYVEFKLACLTGWDIDNVAAHRVDEALHFMGLEAKHQKIREQQKRQS